MLLKTIFGLLATVIMAVPKQKPLYNGELKHYIADLTAAFPCSPYFDSDITWFEADRDDNAYRGIRNVLNGLSDVGFNAIRLPMWPDSEEVFGEVRSSEIGAQM